jgi:cytochrome c-type biogenesis protein CcmH
MKKILFIVMLFCSVTFAASDYYPFTSPEKQQRFDLLTDQLRCLVCQNQNLSSSNAPLAEDLRNQIYEKIQQGESDREIIHYLVTRYGHFVLYRPPLNLTTLGLWISPFLLLIMGISYLIYYIQRRD